MNRERRLLGSNSYERELGVKILSLLGEFAPPVLWVDWCCGTGRALIAWAAAAVLAVSRPA